MIYTASNAKLNLFLEILGKNNLGYHNINSLFVKISLCDRLRIKQSLNTQSSCHIKDIKIKEENIVFKAIRYFERLFDIRVSIDLEIKKNIPLGAGLGGGSANAATVLKCLSKLYNKTIEPSSLNLKKIAYQIGADVPFFLTKYNAALVQHIGETILPFPPLNQTFYFVLINPSIHISTKAIFDRLDIHANKKDVTLDTPNILKKILEEKNHLEKIVVKKYPIIQNYLDNISAQKNCIISKISGTGSTCFGIFDTHRDALEALATLKKLHPSNLAFIEKISL